VSLVYQPDSAGAFHGGELGIFADVADGVYAPKIGAIYFLEVISYAPQCIGYYSTQRSLAAPRRTVEQVAMGAIILGQHGTEHGLCLLIANQLVKGSGAVFQI
jgi:hypothetical protein